MKNDTAAPVTREEIQAVRLALPAALAQIASKFNLEIKPGKASYDSSGFVMKIEFVRAGQEDARLASKFNGILTPQYGLKVGDLVTDSRGTQWQIRGVTRSEKWPLEARRISDGKSFRLSTRSLMHADGKPVVDAWAFPNPVLGIRKV